MEYLLKQKVVVVQTPEWKFKANIARNTTLRDPGTKFFPDLGEKWQKTDYFQEFHFILSVTKLIIIKFLPSMLFKEFLMWVL